LDHSKKDVAMRMHDVMRRLVHHHIRALSFPDLDTDLTRAQMATLTQIGRRNESTMGLLADELGIAPGSLTGVVDRLIEKDLVQRERSSQDRRKVVVRLSRNGEETFVRFRGAATKFSDSLLSLLTPEENGTLLRLMERLVDGLEGRGPDRDKGSGKP